MFIVGKSFFSEILSKFNIQTIAPLSHPNPNPNPVNGKQKLNKYTLGKNKFVLKCFSFFVEIDPSFILTDNTMSIFNALCNIFSMFSIWFVKALIEKKNKICVAWTTGTITSTTMDLKILLNIFLTLLTKITNIASIELCVALCVG